MLLQFTLNQHIRRKKKYTCELCDSQWYTKKNLEVHVVRMRKKMKSFVCRKWFCNRGFSEKEDLDHHQISHLEKLKTKLECDICGKIYFFQKFLDKHKESVHHNPENFDCIVCQKAFTNRRDVNEHMKTIHHQKKDLSDREKFKCEICEKQFLHKRSLTYHNNRFHQKLLPFKCEHCEKAFATIGEKNTHMYI